MLKNFETCAKRYYHYNVAKDVVEPESQQLRDGKVLHARFEQFIKDPAATSMGIGFDRHLPMLRRFRDAPGETAGEQKLAVTADFQPSAFFGRRVWLRAVADALKVLDGKAIIVDWKDGKPRSETTQLQILAAAVFVNFPTVQRVRAALIFVNYDDVVREEYVREDQAEIWAELLPRVRAMDRARRDQEFPPKPSGLCRSYCAVTSCPFHGKGAR